MKYAFFMFGIPMLIFITAFIETRKKLAVFHTLMFIFIILLACVLAFYYKDKLHVLKQLKQVKDLVEYEKGGVVDRSWILEDRMLCAKGLDIREVRSSTVSKVVLLNEEKGKQVLELSVKDEIVLMTTISKEEAQRFVAYLKRKNPSIIVEGIEAKGNGSLQELGAGVQV